MVALAAPYFVIVTAAYSEDRALYLVQSTAADKNTYVVSTRIDALKPGFELATKSPKSKYILSYRLQPHYSANR